MKRRIFSITTILGVLLLIALLVSSHSAFALTPTISRTPTTNKTATKTPSRTSTRTSTRTPTKIPTTITPTFTPTLTLTTSVCPTPERLLVGRVVTPTYDTTQVIQVTLHNGVSVTVSTMSGPVNGVSTFHSFTSTTKVGDVFSVTITLDPNTTTHLTVLGTVNAGGSCGSYDLSTDHASDGSNLIITQLPPGAPTWVPTATPTQTPPPVCSPVDATIASPFTWDGAGTRCWQATTIDNDINSFSMTIVNVNSVNFTNMFVATSGLPPKIGGYWYISVFSSVPWGHFEAK